MKAEIISIGSKFMIDDSLNANIKVISMQLAMLGIEIANHQIVASESSELSSALKTALLRSDLVITIAGMGPYESDITVETVCGSIGRRLVYSPEIEQKIDAFYKSKGSVMPESDMKLAVIPEDSIVIDNPDGIEPGIIIKSDQSKCIIMLPENLPGITGIFEQQIIPELRKYYPTTVVAKEYNVFGMSEQQIKSKLSEIIGSENPKVSFHSSVGEVKIILTAVDQDGRLAEDILYPAESRISVKLDSFVYSEGNVSLQQTVVNELMRNGKKIATAESCTAGLLSKYITDVPGSSEVFDMGVSTYSATMKEQLLGVSEESISKHGEVSPETACEMAAGVRLRGGADYGIGITGVAGPDMQEGKPVGMVYIAVADCENIHAIVLKLGNKSREYIREHAAKTALDMVRRVVLGLGSSLGKSISTAAVEKRLTNISKTAVPLAAAGTAAAGFAVNAAETAVKSTVPELTDDLPQSDDFIFAKEPEKTEEVSGFEINSNFADEQNTKNGLPTIAELEAAAAAQADSIQETNSSEEGFKTGFSFPIADIGGEKSEEKPKTEESAEKPKTDEASKAEDKKRPWYKKLLFWFIPEKGDGRYAIVKIIRIVCIVALVISLTMIISYYRDLYNASGIGKKLPAYDTSNTDVLENGMLAKMKPYFDLNNDTVGYLTIDGIDATGPVVQSTDNDYYLHLDFEKKKNRFGSRFADYRNVFEPDGTVSKNTIIYGHFSDETVIFGELYRYQDTTFFKEHSTIQFSTLYQEKQYKVFAVFITNTDSKPNDDGTVFPYRTTDFGTDEDFLNFVNQIKHRTIVNTGVDILPTDNLLTLSTCSRVFDDARLVVVAREVRPGEDPNQDLNAIVTNPTPLYPDVWYREVDTDAVKPIFDDEIITTEPTTEITTEPSSTTEETTTETTQATTIITLPPQTNPPVVVTVTRIVTVTAPPTTTTKAPETTKKQETTTKATEAPATEPTITPDGDDHGNKPVEE